MKSYEIPNIPRYNLPFQECWVLVLTPSCTASSMRISRRSSMRCSSKWDRCVAEKKEVRRERARTQPPTMFSCEHFSSVINVNWTFLSFNHNEIQKCQEFYLLYWIFVKYFQIIKYSKRFWQWKLEPVSPLISWLKHKTFQTYNVTRPFLFTVNFSSWNVIITETAFTRRYICWLDSMENQLDISSLRQTLGY